VNGIIAQLDLHIAAMTQARAILLAAMPFSAQPVAKKLGRPAGTPNKKKRVISAEGRKRISEAMKARHAAKKATKKAPVTKSK
jgi:hypothetical protein